MVVGCYPLDCWRKQSRDSRNIEDCEVRNAYAHGMKQSRDSRNDIHTAVFSISSSTRSNQEIVETGKPRRRRRSERSCRKQSRDSRNDVIHVWRTPEPTSLKKQSRDSRNAPVIVPLEACPGTQGSNQEIVETAQPQLRSRNRRTRKQSRDSRNSYMLQRLQCRPFC